MRYVLMLVALAPKAAKLPERELEATVKHCPLAQSVVVVWVSALNTVINPVAPKNPPAPS